MTDSSLIDPSGNPVELFQPKIDEAAVEITKREKVGDGREWLLRADATAGAIHRFDLSGVRSADGKELEGKSLYYQASELP